jgi:hypothetical protein
MRVFIATQTIAIIVQTETKRSIMRMARQLRDSGDGADWFNYDGAYVTRPRQILRGRIALSLPGTLMLGFVLTVKLEIANEILHDLSSFFLVHYSLDL